ncbi:flagellar protein FlgN [Alkalihalobacillus sp. MEB130]|uniref:flagellar protein FlgN n=1 Tax=Alkalihalobacillus sp. MEB130 TaxID=2976704 RepID=UPI0028DF139D|nr:flagellar protein FlgN [Alkalihalobacillus sp. MEB130]MDT8858790.1 flagellar protein FlgN [Alkalihalobacillus sp. MEB130]
MSAKAIAQLMERLIEIHEGLIDLAVKKVEPIKKGDMPVLEKLIREESKLARQLQTTEMLRAKVVRTFLLEKGEAKEGATLSDVKKHVEEAEQTKFDELQKILITHVIKLKQQNELNQALIEESLRFVNLSLDLMIPHKEDISYNPKDRDDQPMEGGHSLFDSKA